MRYVIPFVLLSLLLVGCFNDAPSAYTWSVEPIHYDDQLLTNNTEESYRTLALWAGITNMNDNSEPSLDDVVLSMNVVDANGNRGELFVDNHNLPNAVQTQEKFLVGKPKYGYLHFLVPSDFSVNESVLTLRFSRSSYAEAIVVDLKDVRPLSSVKR